VRNGVDAPEQGSLVHARRGRGRKAKDDLRFNARLGQSCQREGVIEIGKIVDRAIVDIAPHWGVVGPRRAAKHSR
jgi:hypothetical protein